MHLHRLPPYHIDRILFDLEDADRIDWGLSLLHVPDHWKQTAGQGIRVAVLDTGIDATHPDLASAIDGTRDFTNSPIGTNDAQGHGTHTAGIIAARKNNLGVVGVAPECRLLIGKVLGDDGSGLGSWVAAGIDWAIEQGADVISLSLGSPSPDPTILAAIQRAAAKGKFIIAAAGNDGGTSGVDRVNFPGRWKETLAVAAFDRTGHLAPFSSQGPEVAIAAPGVEITSTFPLALGSYAKLSGTSMATPFVSGVVALLLSLERHTANPPATNSPTPPPPLTTIDQLRELLAKSAVDAGPPGKDWGYGYGLVSPDAFLANFEQQPPGTPGTPGDQPGTPGNPPGTSPSEFRLGPVVIHIPARPGDLASVSVV
jgi:subtilisin family serine protease